ncbi:helix-turn-helix domain-containing protein [Phormidium tenue FACHB-886]|nr:helix-turn-helix domain-containing protein [Phormidium tenue FACHB-886]
MTKDNPLTQQEQIQRLMQIGAYLRQVREDHALSLEEVAARTLIQPRLLRAIESGEMHQLPEPVYIQGFIKRYADSLGLDGSDCAEAFPTEKAMRVPAQATWTASPAAQLRPLHLYVAYIALIVASVSLLSHIVERSATAPSSSASPQAATVPAQPAQNTSATANSPAAVGLSTIAASPSPSRPATSAKPVQVEMKLTAQSWIEVEVDGEVKLAEVLPEGAERSWTADKELRIRAGNAGGVELAYNGGAAELMGAPGAVEEKTFSPGSPSSATQNNASVPKPE